MDALPSQCGNSKVIGPILPAQPATSFKTHHTRPLAFSPKNGWMVDTLPNFSHDADLGMFPGVGWLIVFAD
jgi:hypothetical protein